jgi:hypothetical protein
MPHEIYIRGRQNSGLESMVDCWPCFKREAIEIWGDLQIGKAVTCAKYTFEDDKTLVCRGLLTADCGPIIEPTPSASAQT